MTTPETLRRRMSRGCSIVLENDVYATWEEFCEVQQVGLAAADAWDLDLAIHKSFVEHHEAVDEQCLELIARLAEAEKVVYAAQLVFDYEKPKFIRAATNWAILADALAALAPKEARQHG